MLKLGGPERLTGLGKKTLAGSITAESWSATRQDDGSNKIDPAELHRAYPFRAPQDAADASIAANGTATVSDPTALLEAQITGLREMGKLLLRQLDDAKKDRDRWRARAERLALRGPEPEKKRPEPEKRSRWAWMRSTG
jgi:hypothetical protein